MHEEMLGDGFPLCNGKKIKKNVLPGQAGE